MKSSSSVYPHLPFLDLTSDSFPYAVMASDIKGRILYVNHAFTRLTGFSFEESVGKNPRDFLKSGQQSSDFYKEMYAKIMLGEPWDGYLQNKRKNGEIYYEHEIIYPVKDEMGNVESFLTIKRDVTSNQKNIQLFEQLNKVVEQSAELVFVTDREGIIDYVNPAFEKITGYSQEEALGKSPKLLKSGVHTEEEYVKLWEDLNEGKSLEKIFVNKKKNGETYYQQTTITPITNDDGEITHFVNSGTDITQKILEEEESKNRLKYLEAIYTVSSALGPAKDIPELLQILLEQILIHTNSKIGGIRLYDPKKKQLLLTHAIGYGEYEYRAAPLNAGEGIPGYVIQTMLPHVSEDLSTDPLMPESVRKMMKPGFGGITIPIIKTTEPLGTITLSYPSSQKFSESQISMLMAFTEIAANAIQRIRLRQQTEQQLDFVRSMREIDQVILSSMDLKLSFEIILTHVLNQLKVDAASILIYDPYTNRL